MYVYTNSYIYNKQVLKLTNYADEKNCDPIRDRQLSTAIIRVIAENSCLNMDIYKKNWRSPSRVA